MIYTIPRMEQFSVPCSVTFNMPELEWKLDSISILLFDDDFIMKIKYHIGKCRGGKCVVMVVMYG